MPSLDQVKGAVGSMGGRTQVVAVPGGFKVLVHREVIALDLIDGEAELVKKVSHLGLSCCGRTKVGRGGVFLLTGQAGSR